MKTLFFLICGIISATFCYSQPYYSFTSSSVVRSGMPEQSEFWPNFVSEIAFEGGYVSGDVSIFLGNGNSAITNPVIIVDGFDPNDLRPVEGLWELVNQQNMADSLIFFGNDIILLNFHDGGGYIQQNAMLFINLIDTVQYIMGEAGTLKENPQIVVVGPSMGGLITRYALTYMEKTGMHHHVRNWVSFDSPHKGANIPLGIQHWLRFFAEVAGSEGAQAGLTKVNSVAAKQMMLYHYSATAGGLAGSDAMRNVFVNDIDTMGFPLQTRIVAVANGSGAGISQPFEAGEQAVEFYYSDLVVDLRGDIWAVPHQVNSIIFHGLYNTIMPLDEVEEIISVSNTISVDNAPGGDSPTFWEIAEEDPGYGDILCLHEDHCFIPTISSLCITNTNDLFFNVHDNIESVETPFDKLYYPIDNQEHAEITPESYQWFKLEIHNFAPQFVEIPYQEVIAENFYSLQVSASDTNYWNSLSFAAISLPTWITFNSETAVLSGTPQAVDQGFNHVILEVNDGLLKDTIEFDINVLSGSQLELTEQVDFKIYPNPCDDKVTIEFNSEKCRSIFLSDMSGKVLISMESCSNSEELFLNKLQPSVYFLTVVDGDIIERKSLIKIH